ncbi:MAG: YraN family protein [Gammaproteobacteria bacterium]|nr:YraN family protein [Gammaproteobacteria bacterium]MBU2678245.1 YraN family protein [Gammaproteobacteria bacterium]NNC56050.1 YraN family protein [Woeseiaceae bacterium]NNL51980.1 YraN family protein [Woeseiaceae bacterium]
MGSRSTGTVGDRAEQKALGFLVRQGLKPVTQNFRCRSGEIDLIMLHGDCLTFVEVRYRKSTRFSPPASTVDPRKQRKIVRTAALFLSSMQRYARHTMRFDIVAISGDKDRTVEWIQDAFRPGDSSL